MHSSAQSRKLLRNPCTVARPASPVVLSSVVSVMSDNSLPLRKDEGKTRPEPSPSSRARLSARRILDIYPRPLGWTTGIDSDQDLRKTF